VPAAHALEIGLIDAIREADEPEREKPPVPSPRFAALEEFFAKHPVAALLNPAFEPPRDPNLLRAWLRMRGRAPAALRLVETIIDRGLQVSLAEGLQIEYAHLREIFATEDARAALHAYLAGGQRPADGASGGR
jgi:enoyl-CoA hydratase/carnithine racemase